MRFAAEVIYWVRRILGLIVPGFSAAQDFYKHGPVVRWVLRILAFIGIFFLAWFAQSRWDWLNDRITNPPDWLQPYWLACTILCSLFIAWNIWWLWKLATDQYENIEFPDIANAWKSALAKLREQAAETAKTPKYRDQGIDLANTPIYLVLGRPAAGEEGLFSASQVGWRIRGIPAGADEPIHVWACKDAIVITCAGASQLGALAKAISKETIQGAPNEQIPIPGPEPRPSEIRRALADSNPSVNILRGSLGRGNEMPSASGQGTPSGSRPPTSDSGADRGTREPMGGGGLRGTIIGGIVRAGNRLRQSIGGGSSPAAAVINPVASFIRNHPERELHATRLRYLCRIMARDLKPRCPLNGVMLLVPSVILDKNLMGDCAAVCKQDVATVRESLQLDFVTIAVVCDVEKIPGFSEFRKAFPGDMKHDRLGSGIPPKPDLDQMGISYPQLLEKTMKLICNQTISSFVFERLRTDNPEDKPSHDRLRSNMELYRFLSQIQARKAGLTRVLRSLIPPNEGTVMCGGCYMVASGQEPKEQAFIPGVFGKLLTSGFERVVYWRKRALDLDAKYKRFTYAGYATIVVTALVVLASTYLFFKSATGEN